jgi:hypothetical protein
MIKTLYATLMSPILVTCPAHHILHLITRKFDKKYRLSSAAFRSLLHSSGTYSLLGPNIILSTLFSKAFRCVPTSMSETKLRTRVKQQANYRNVYLNLHTFG